MPMTRAEKAEMQFLRDQLALERALRWTAAVEPDVPPPDGVTVTRGWLPLGEQSDRPRVEIACSSAVFHGIGTHITSQGARSLYSTRLLALRGLRHQVEVHVAGILARIDAQIAAEAAKKGDA